MSALSGSNAAVSCCNSTTPDAARRSSCCQTPLRQFRTWRGGASAPINPSPSDQPPPGLRRNSCTHPADTPRTPPLPHLLLSPPCDSSQHTPPPPNPPHPRPTLQKCHPHFSPRTPARSPSCASLETLLSNSRTKATRGSLNLCPTEAGSYFKAPSLRLSSPFHPRFPARLGAATSLCFPLLSPCVSSN